MCCRGAAATQQLEQILDGMHATKVLLGDRFELAGSEHRRTGSHGIVEAAEVPGTSVRFNSHLGATAVKRWEILLKFLYAHPEITPANIKCSMQHRKDTHQCCSDCIQIVTKP